MIGWISKTQHEEFRSIRWDSLLHIVCTILQGHLGIFRSLELYTEYVVSGPGPSEGQKQLVFRVVITALHMLEAPLLCLSK